MYACMYRMGCICMYMYMCVCMHACIECTCSAPIHSRNLLGLHMRACMCTCMYVEALPWASITHQMCKKNNCTTVQLYCVSSFEFAFSLSLSLSHTSRAYLHNLTILLRARFRICVLIPVPLCQAAAS